MKNFQTVWIGLVLAIVLIGCSSDEESSQPTNNEDKVDEETTDSESEDVLRLGETGEVSGVLGNYEITVNSFEILDEIEGEPSLMEILVLVHFEVTNIDDLPIVGKDVYNGRLFNDENTSQGNLYDFESVKMLTEEEIQPGETVEAEMLFDQDNSDYYELVFNFGALESNATILTWRFDANEASNQ
ncbi:hypothetical protein GI584_08730 [Gracilibacillus salitolerans]|uniref:DUF4352 domain-containing protein n=1 Tax=Gracilibacillus salitolerans TaxID=2663022 RepID=A0A5Q2TGZ0_9BACI|nr:hypothetical protein [Gracilibacillus salitolerans]QGH34099.1 hypothetical protein GI584_08730 [Gracilibacillus salitolerans]